MTSRKRHFPDTASMIDIGIQETGTDGLILCFVLILFFFPSWSWSPFSVIMLSLLWHLSQSDLNCLSWDGLMALDVLAEDPGLVPRIPVEAHNHPSILVPEDLTPTPSFLSIAHTCTQACVPGKTFAWNNSKHLNVCSIWKTRSIEYCVDWRQWGVKWKQPCHPMKHNIISWWHSRWR